MHLVFVQPDHALHEGVIVRRRSSRSRAGRLRAGGAGAQRIAVYCRLRRSDRSVRRARWGPAAALPDRHLQRGQDQSASRQCARARPGIFWAYPSTTNATSVHPAHVRTYVKSMIQVRFGAAVKSRFSRSPARAPSLAGMVVRIPCSGDTLQAKGSHGPVHRPWGSIREAAAHQHRHLPPPVQSFRGQPANTVVINCRHASSRTFAPRPLRVLDDPVRDRPVGLGPVPVGFGGDLTARAGPDRSIPRPRGPRCATRPRTPRWSLVAGVEFPAKKMEARRRILLSSPRRRTWP